MKLMQWMRENGVTVTAVAAATGAATGSVDRWVMGFCPQARYLKKLRRLTKGQVLAADFPQGDKPKPIALGDLLVPRG